MNYKEHNQGNKTGGCMALKKEFHKSGKKCKVTFIFSREESMNAEKVALLGEFNDWDPESNLMEKDQEGNFKCLVELEKNKEYQFRYLVDDQRWENDFEADSYQYSEFGNCDNSVVKTIK